MVRNNTFRISWINGGLSSNPAPYSTIVVSSNPAPYSTIVDADFSHGAVDCCLMRYTARAGLNFVQCRGCGASAIINTAGRGSVKLACLAIQSTAQPEPVVTPFPTRARQK